jgi:hypothetical protein
MANKELASVSTGPAVPVLPITYYEVWSVNHRF